MKKLFFAMALLAMATFAFGQTATKYFVAHQGGYIGVATVTVDKAGKVVEASIDEWQGPGGFAEFTAPDGKSTADGYVIRVSDPLANAANADPEIKGYMFYVYKVKDGAGLWVQYTPGKDAFAASTNYTRDFEGMMGNPIRAKAYAEAAQADTIVSVTTEGLKVIVGKKASETVHYGHMNKSDVRANYMPVAAASIGYRYNMKATIDFFKANPTANFAAAVTKKTKVSVNEDASVEAADLATYTAADDQVFAVADAVTGATFSDYPHYSLELQTAYKMALAESQVDFQK